MAEELDDTEHLMSSDKNKERLLESIEQANSVSDEELLGCYMHGFMDELDNNLNYDFDSPIKNRAYNIGKSHALIGDDVRSVDYLSNDEIIKQIRNYERT
jgi:hypothetical protein